MAIPNPIDFDPYEELTDTQMNQLIENDVALADGTALATNSVAARTLAADAISLGYTAITSNFTTTSGTATQVTDLTSTVTIPAGARAVEITVYVSRVFTAAGGGIVVTLWDGTVGSGTQLQAARFDPSNINLGVPITLVARVTPSAGSKTYNVGLNNTSGGNNATLVAAATTPAFILVKAI